MKRPMFITVRGRQHEWVFKFDGEPQDLPEWIADGLNVHRVAAVVPDWAANAGLGPLFAAAQRAWQWVRIL